MCHLLFSTNVNNLDIIAINLKFLRRKKGLKQNDMQVELGISRSTWSNYENGFTKPDIDTIIRISDYFVIDCDTLLRVNLNAASQKMKTLANEGEEFYRIKSRTNPQNGDHVEDSPGVQKASIIASEEYKQLAALLAARESEIAALKSANDALKLATDLMRSQLDNNKGKK